MSTLTECLATAAEAHKGTELGGLLQWAVLHIQSQDAALEEVRQDLEDEERARLHLERAAHEAKLSIEEALKAIAAPLSPPTELSKDCSGHINLMAAHGENPDYLMKSGKSVRHVDLRETKGRKKK